MDDLICMVPPTVTGKIVESVLKTNFGRAGWEPIFDEAMEGVEPADFAKSLPSFARDAGKLMNELQQGKTVDDIQMDDDAGFKMLVSLLRHQFVCSTVDHLSSDWEYADRIQLLPFYGKKCEANAKKLGIGKTFCTATPIIRMEAKQKKKL